MGLEEKVVNVDGKFSVMISSSGNESTKFCGEG